MVLCGFILFYRFCWVGLVWKAAGIENCKVSVSEGVVLGSYLVYTSCKSQL